MVVFGRMLYNWARKKDCFLIVNIPESQIRELYEGISQNSRQIRSLIEDIRKKEEQKKEAEINFLQAQINPHFICNTIFSTSCMIQTGEAKKASAMLVEFINLLSLRRL